MSCWIVSKAHIDTLTNAAVQLRVIKADQADELGKVLWAGNYRGVGYRYSEDESAPDYERTVFDAPFHPIGILAVLDSYDYQSCDAPDWDRSEACAWSAKIAAAAEGLLSADQRKLVQDSFGDVEAYRLTTIYQSTPWGVDDMREVPRVVEEEA